MLPSKPAHSRLTFMELIEIPHTGEENNNIILSPLTGKALKDFEGWKGRLRRRKRKLEEGRDDHDQRANDNSFNARLKRFKSATLDQRKCTMGVDASHQRKSKRPLCDRSSTKRPPKKKKAGAQQRNSRRLRERAARRTTMELLDFQLEGVGTSPLLISPIKLSAPPTCAQDKSNQVQIKSLREEGVLKDSIEKTEAPVHEDCTTRTQPQSQMESLADSGARTSTTMPQSNDRNSSKDEGNTPAEDEAPVHEENCTVSTQPPAESLADDEVETSNAMSQINNSHSSKGEKGEFFEDGQETAGPSSTEVEGFVSKVPLMRGSRTPVSKPALPSAKVSKDETDVPAKIEGAGARLTLADMMSSQVAKKISAETSLTKPKALSDVTNVVSARAGKGKTQANKGLLGKEGLPQRRSGLMRPKVVRKTNHTSTDRAHGNLLF